MPDAAPGSAEAVVPRVLLFFDYACPFCYVDLFRFLRLAEEHAVDLVPCPLELRPAMPEGGISASEHGLTHGERVEQHLTRLASAEGARMTHPDLVPKTHLAMAMAELARDTGPDMYWRVHLAVFDAYYGAGLDIGDRDVLLGVAREQGLDADEVEAAWEEGVYEARLEQFRHLAGHLGVSATPAALVCNTLLIGSRPYRVIEEALEECLITPERAEREAAEGAGGDAEAAAGDEAAAARDSVAGPAERSPGG